MGDKYLFINNSDLADTDSNGRTLRDVFSYVPNKDIFSFCTRRSNFSLEPDQVFFIDEAHILKPRRFSKTVHCYPLNCTNKSPAKKKLMKNPLTCILRNFIWSLSFVFFKHKLKKWIIKIKPDYIVFDPSDFLFLHKLARYISKICKKQLILYNTEDYYFKNWNYLHKDHGFGFMFPIFRIMLKANYKKTFNKTGICFHNVEGLKDEYESAFPKAKHFVVYHPSNLVSNNSKYFASGYLDFYYCGVLDKGRDNVMVLLAEELLKISPKSKIYFNGVLKGSFNEEFVNHIGNVVNLGFCSYQDVANRVSDKYILISVASLDEYNAKDKYHGFSTKLSDYIASFNPIIHIGPIGDEYNILKKYNLAFVCCNQDNLKNVIKELFDSLSANNNDKYEAQKQFYSKFLNPEITSIFIKETIKEHIK